MEDFVGKKREEMVVNFVVMLFNLSISFSAMASVCWRSSVSSSLPLGSTSTTSRASGAPSVTS